MIPRPRLGLDVSVPDSRTSAEHAFEQGAPGQQARPDAQTQGRFQQAMAQAPEPAPGPETPKPAMPMGLFAAPLPSPQEQQVRATVSALIGEMVDRLMVGDDGAGGKQVRMELKDEPLPGVTVTVNEQEGRLRVEFVCSNETSRLRLNAALPREAPVLAQRLARDVWVRVLTDDEEDPCLFELTAAP